MKTRNGRNWALSITIIAAFCLAAAVAAPNDGAVLQAFLKGVANGASLGWTGTDYCGGTWTGVTCSGGNVVQLRLRDSGLGGTVTPTLNQLTDLTYLELPNNGFTGAMPSLAGMANLQNVYLHQNNFTSIPGDFFNGLTNVVNLYIDRNTGLNGTAGWTFPEAITSSTLLANLSVASTNLNSIPDYVAAMPSLRVLLAAYNNIPSIPAAFAGSNIEVLQVNNQGGMKGTMAPCGQMPAVKLLWLQVNQLTGPIPDGLVDAKGLTDLRLSDNLLVGQIPMGLANLPITTAFFKNNYLSGQMPPFPGTVNVSSDAADFCAAGGSPCSAQVTALLQFLKDGGYPETLSQSWIGADPCVGWSGVTCAGTDVVSLSLAKVGFTGTISPFLANLTSLRQILLNDNALTGSIPTALTTLPVLQTLDVSNNNISGLVPVFPSNVTFRSTGNPFLGTVLPPPSSAPGSPGATPGAASGSSSSSSNVGMIVGIVVGVLALVIAVVILAICLRRRKKRKYSSLMQGQNTVVHPQGDSGSDPELGKIVAGHRAAQATDGTRTNYSGPSDYQVEEGDHLGTSYEVLREVTENFAEKNVLGKGGFGVVYKGTFPDGTMVAVKRMEAAVMSTKGLKEFQSEISVLSKVRHRNLVELKGYCAYRNERLLVYEYMAQGTLAQHLFEYKSLGTSPLEWTRRLSIALDVARGLEYLHGLAHKSFIHRDLKPSNILLGDNWHAKVSDFGLVKLAPENNFSVETRLAGTFGYLAPEYAVTGRVTTKADVFSFGVCLMEMMTGRRALDETELEENMHLVTWFRRTNTSQETFINCIDPTITVDDETLKSLNTVSDLALLCTQREPYQRPDMAHAVNVLKPLVEQWKPAKTLTGESSEEIDLQLTLPEALKQWQDLEDYSFTGGDDRSRTSTGIPVKPHDFANTFTSNDGR